MKRETAILLMALSLATPGAVSAAAVAAIFTAANSASVDEEVDDSAQFEAIERETEVQPDAWKAYQQVLNAVPKNASTGLKNRYRSLAVSLALKAAMTCSPEALKLLERNDVIEFRVLRLPVSSSCRTAK